MDTFPKNFNHCIMFTLCSYVLDWCSTRGLPLFLNLLMLFSYLEESLLRKFAANIVSSKLLQLKITGVISPEFIPIYTRESASIIAILFCNCEKIFFRYDILSRDFWPSTNPNQSVKEKYFSKQTPILVRKIYPTWTLFCFPPQSEVD